MLPPLVAVPLVTPTVVPTWVVWWTAAAALAAVASPITWPVLRSVLTIAHEGGHAAVAVAAGRQLTGVRLHSDTSGVTVSRGRPTGVGVVLVLCAGYPAPTALGLLGAFALAHGRIAAVLWGAIVLLLLLLMVVRNVFGVVSVVLTGGVLFALAWWAPPAAQAAGAYAVCWFLLLGGPRPVLELRRSRRRMPVPTSDADQLAGLTGVPGAAWVVLFLALTLGGLVLGGGLLLDGRPPQVIPPGVVAAIAGLPQWIADQGAGWWARVWSAIPLPSLPSLPSLPTL